MNSTLNSETGPMETEPGRRSSRPKRALDKSHQNGREANPKKRRRILSCDTCRRLKSRCEFPNGQDVCSRCRTLRISCLRPDDEEIPRSAPSETQASEDRLSQLETTVTELKSLVTTLLDRGSRSSLELPDSGPTPHAVPTPNSESTVHLVDQNLHYAPAQVLRRVTSQLNGGLRRPLGHDGKDLITCGILDEPTASGLLTAFFKEHGQFLLVDDASELVLGGPLHETSPFLHAVCCLRGFRTTKCELFGSGLHRQVYEHVRQMLGEAFLASPLDMPELLGVLIMSLFSTSPTQGPEYIDSWLLSGHCAQQAMLSIEFSAITNRIDTGSSTLEDLKTFRLWANICLVHLHWAVTTGRPSVIPSTYLKQCDTLLRFPRATISDIILYAETLLYSAVDENLFQFPSSKSDETDNALLTWRIKWAYLFDLPLGSILKMSYQIACLIMARRALEHYCRQRKSVASGTSLSLGSNFVAIDRENNTRDDDAISDSSEDVVCVRLQKRTLSSAIQVVQAFVGIKSPSGEHLPEFFLVCVSYAVLLISQARDDQIEEFTHSQILEMLIAVQEKCQSTKFPKPMSVTTERCIQRFRGNSHANDGIESIPTVGNISTTEDPIEAALSGTYKVTRSASPSSIWAGQDIVDFFSGGFALLEEFRECNGYSM
ncbi:hypothetical protein EDB80DRAFT_727783 [Ilyonectria destructans]|nr:hypothetical protein EDB80DRAFT_727783 [Ilyonectria destructans]